MSQVYRVDPARPDAAEDALRSAVAEVRAGHLVVFPTETVYGLAARPDDPDATRLLFEAKGRPAELNLPILAASPDESLSLVEPTETAIALAARFWPGPLTLVLPRSGVSAQWYLGEHDDTIGVRMPDDPIALALLRATGPLAATSANRSGGPPLLDPEPLVEAFGASVAVYLVLGPGVRLPGQRPSTVVDLTGPSYRVIREGPIDGEALRVAVGGVQTGPTG